MNNKLMNLEMFGENDKDFFTNAFDEAYNISTGEEEVIDTPSEPVESTESVSTKEVEQIPVVEDKAPVEPPKLSKEEIKALYEETYGVPSEPQIDEQTQSALELYKYLESNPQLVQAMRDVDVEAYQSLNTFVPDEITKKLQTMEEYIQEQQYNSYISDLKGKYKDFNEDEVLKYAEQRELFDLEVAYKALKADSIKEPNLDEIKEQIRKELLEELKQNSLNTQSIVGGINQKPINNDEEVKLSAKEQRVANAMGLSPKEYVKWR